MKLALLLGYDGPVKVWIDGVRKYVDPKGTNPALPDAARIPFDAEAGSHDVLVALGSNEGRAWGIFLRCERLDVSKRLLEMGPAHYAMPIVEG